MWTVPYTTRMKHGAEYLHSDEKRAVDLVIGSVLAPVPFAASALARLTFAQGEELYFEQPRLGQNGRTMLLKKIRTLGADGSPLSDLADKYRAKGYDELPQLELVRQGVMSVFGSRPLIDEEYEVICDKASKTNRGRNLIAKHIDIVIPAKRGLISRFGFLAHSKAVKSPLFDRLELDIQDHENASFTYDMRTLFSGLRMAAKNELTKGGTKPKN